MSNPLLSQHSSIWILAPKIRIIWSKFRTRLFVVFLISFSSVMHYDSSFGFLNSNINAFLISVKFLVYLIGVEDKYFIYHNKERSLKVVSNCAIFVPSFCTCLTIHKASQTDKCCSGSSNLVPWNIGILVSSPIVLFVVFPFGGIDWLETIKPLLSICWLIIPLL